MTEPDPMDLALLIFGVIFGIILMGLGRLAEWLDKRRRKPAGLGEIAKGGKDV